MTRESHLLKEKRTIGSCRWKKKVCAYKVTMHSQFQKKKKKKKKRKEAKGRVGCDGRKAEERLHVCIFGGGALTIPNMWPICQSDDPSIHASMLNTCAYMWIGGGGGGRRRRQVCRPVVYGTVLPLIIPPANYCMPQNREVSPPNSSYFTIKTRWEA